jgi:hypothetical protein
VTGLLVNDYSQRNPPTLGEAMSGLLGNWGSNIEQGLLSALPVLAENDPYKIGQQLLREGAGVGGIAWHGSPHKFTRPDLSKIGTGEGAQAYGHGFYSAEAKNIGEIYRNDLSGQISLDGKELDFVPNTDDPFGAALVDKMKGDDFVQKQIRLANKSMGDSDPDAQLWFEKYIDELERLKGKSISRNPGHLYKMNIPDETIGKMLDWDKPLSEQKYALKSLRDHYEKTYGDPDIVMQQLGLSPKMRGGELYRELGGTMQNQRHASGVLNTAGIPGIKYLDGMSRAAGQGSRNFVSFTPDHIEMLERNGVPMKGLLD